MNTLASRWRTPVLLAAVLALVLASGERPRALSSGIVISQVYGGGGSAGGVYTYDFVELFNRGTEPVNVRGWSIQYASAAGGASLGASALLLTPLPDITIAPGQYLLIQEGGNGYIAELPTPDVADLDSPIPMMAESGKVALVTDSLPLGCNGGSTKCSAEQLARVVDLVGYGSANFYEGTPAPTLTAGTAAIRGGAGCADTDDNGNDFTAGVPIPRNSASPANPCGSAPQGSDVKVGQSQVPNPAESGEDITYAVQVTNSSKAAAYGLSLDDRLPAGTTYQRHQAPAGWVCTPVAEGLVCQAPSMPAEATASFTVVARVGCDTPNGSSLTNHVHADSAMFDPDPGNNDSRLPATVGNPPPVVSNVLAAPASLWPVTHKMVPVTIDYAVADNCDPAPRCTLSVASNERTDGRGDGHTATDWQVIDDHRILLRAERSGGGQGRTYTVTIACSDGAGGTTTQAVKVSVPHSQK